jgi:formate dehydrogenase subunit gamma
MPSASTSPTTAACPKWAVIMPARRSSFRGMTILLLVLATSGIAIWDARFGQHFKIEQKRIADVVHAAATVVAIGLWIIHDYAAIWVKGTVRAMTRGSVTGCWAWKHHRNWLREEVAKEPR